MAQPQLKTEWLHDEPASPVRSPVHTLQHTLGQTIAAPAPHVDKWSRRRALAFIVGSSCALWMAILAAGAQIVRAVA